MNKRTLDERILHEQLDRKDSEIRRLTKEVERLTQELEGAHKLAASTIAKLAKATYDYLPGDTLFGVRFTREQWKACNIEPPLWDLDPPQREQFDLTDHAYAQGLKEYADRVIAHLAKEGRHTCLTCGRQTCDRQPEDFDPSDCKDWKPPNPPWVANNSRLNKLNPHGKPWKADPETANFDEPDLAKRKLRANSILSKLDTLRKEGKP